MHSTTRNKLMPFQLLEKIELFSLIRSKKCRAIIVLAEDPSSFHVAAAKKKNISFWNALTCSETVQGIWHF